MQRQKECELSGMFRRSSALAIRHRKSFAAIPSISLVLLGHTTRKVKLSHESQRELALEETEGKLEMLVSPKENGLKSLFKEVRVFKVCAIPFQGGQHSPENGVTPPLGLHTGASVR